MTRYTNLGRKRTHVEAGFNYRDEDEIPTHTLGASTSTGPVPQVQSTSPGQPPAESETTTAASTELSSEKRKRKRSKKRKESGEGQDEHATEHGEEGVTGDGQGKEVKTSTKSEKIKKANSKLKDKNKAKRVKGAFPCIFTLLLKAHVVALFFHVPLDAADRAAASEKRRLKRIAERHANTICFVCRQSGHAAVMCPNNANNESEDAAAGAKKGQDIVGICYRYVDQVHSHLHV